MSNEQSHPIPEFAKLFTDSLAKWGGWPKQVSYDSKAFVRPVSKTITAISQHQKQNPSRVGKLSQEHWTPIAETLPLFLNAYLQQELDRILDGPREFITALRLVDENVVGQLLMALIIVAREHYLQVEVSYTDPYSKRVEQSKCHLSCEQCPTTLTIEIGREHGEEHLPLVLHYHGNEYVCDKEESTPQNPAWVPVSIDRRAAIFFDGSAGGDLSLEEMERDEFLRRQGFQSIRFSRSQLENDLFGCAAEAIKLISGRKFPPS
jgi:hypothetical protein